MAITLSMNCTSCHADGTEASRVLGATQVCHADRSGGISSTELASQKELTMKTYFVYCLSNISNRVLYIGVTNNLLRRVYEHRQHKVEGFTCKYNVTKLVYFEQTLDIQSAISREKQLKGWRREKKNNLINSFNPGWKDLYPELSAG